MRRRRTGASLTYEQLAELVRGRVSGATLKRATSGASVPSWDTVVALVQNTTTDAEEIDEGALALALAYAEELWKDARRATRATYYLHKAPDPTLIANRADLSQALRDQHTWCGAPSPREMEEKAGIGQLPSSTARRILAGRILPVSTEQTIAFLLACYVRPPHLDHWMHGAIRAGVTSQAKWELAYGKVVERRRTENQEQSTLAA
ncbi:helix-turn-helix domain-containing protein [Streptomyces sp. NPDC058301]|uniref:helix-turn-helix domain-containing protein n=1 Tax=Streptomyces sp. NPDC058301 TaxID=3346436 RepID=UPI0036DFBB49